MAAFVIVHGAFGGGWEWTPVADLLRASGHLVFTPTLTGLGERRHLAPMATLTTNVDDLVAVLDLEDLHDVVLCGASYGGMAVTGAADRRPDRIALVVYIDALVPRDGQWGAELLPAPFRAMIVEAAEGEGGLLPVPDAVLPPAGLIPEATRQHYIARLAPQPVATLTERIALTGAVEALPRAFVRCTGGALDEDPIEPMARRAREEGWPYRALPLPHDPHLFDPAATASVLDELAATAGLQNRAPLPNERRELEPKSR